MGSTYNYPELSTEGQPVLLLSVHNTQDLKLIKQFLPDSMAIETSSNGIANRDFDLCIMDHPSFEANKQSLQELKDTAAPIFLPFLLLSPNKKAIRNNATMLELADDVVYIPASPKLLQSRISLLLKQREYSLKLEEKNRELAEEKRKYQLITENSTDMISRHTPDGTYLYVSPASKELTGYTPEELMGQNALDNMHPEDSERLREEVRSFEDNKIERWEFRKKTKESDYKWVESVMRPIGDKETGKIIEIQASTRDISERKDFEKKLREEKEFIDKSIQSLPELFYLIDEDLNIVKWNNIDRELGYSDEEVEQMHPLEFYHKEDREFAISKLIEASITGSAEAEMQMLAKSGELIPYYVKAKSFSRGDKDYIVGFCMNLSAIKEAQYELEQQRQLLDAVINQTKSLVYVKDKDRKYQLVNESYLRIFDLSREEVIGKTSEEVHGQTFAEKVEPYDSIVFETDEMVELQEELPINKYETRVYHTIKYPLKEIYGFENCLCGISTDVTDRIKYEQQLKVSLSEKETLLQEIHHRVKNNLAVVSGMMELQTLSTENKEVKRLLSASKNRIKTMALIHEKLYQSQSLSQIEFGSYVKDLLDNVRQVSVNSEDIELNLEFDSFNLNVNQAVPCALMINEVVSNAFEHAFSDKKNGCISVSLEEQDNTILIRIKDNGSGLPDDFSEKKNNSMGFAIIDTLITQLEADKEMKNDDGFSFAISFEKQEVKGSSSTLV
ncbi:PAS domain S-box protein [Fodinibius salicampi]|nr:PAS domain S-box protein [Fodinibius salicampi]